MPARSVIDGPEPVKSAPGEKAAVALGRKRSGRLLTVSLRSTREAVKQLSTYTTAHIKRLIGAQGKPHKALSLGSVGRTEKKNVGNGRPLGSGLLFSAGVVNQRAATPRRKKAPHSQAGGSPMRRSD